MQRRAVVGVVLAADEQCQQSTAILRPRRRSRSASRDVPGCAARMRARAGHALADHAASTRTRRASAEPSLEILPVRAAAIPDCRTRASSPEVAAGRKARPVTDRGDHRRGGDHVDAGDRHQPLDVLVGQRDLRDLAIDELQLCREEIELTQITSDRLTLIAGQLKRGDPRATALAEQVDAFGSTYSCACTRNTCACGGRSHTIAKRRLTAPQLGVSPGIHPLSSVGGEPLGERARVELIALPSRD